MTTEKLVPCRKCGGKKVISGPFGQLPCYHCNENGQVPEHCTDCGGTGKKETHGAAYNTVTVNCSKCRGTGKGSYDTPAP